MSDTFEYTRVNGVTSEALSVVAYNDNDGQMFVRFTNGNERVYSAIPEAEYDGLVNADSVGRYYNFEIYGQYESEPLSNTKLIAVALAEDPATTTKAEYEPLVPVGDPWGVASAPQASITISSPDTSVHIPNVEINLKKSRFGIRWEIPGTSLSSEPVYEASTADEAFRHFAADAETFLGPDVQVKVTAVVHYLD